MAEQDLKLKTGIEGTENVVGGLGKIEGAQKKVSGTTKDSKKPVADLTAEQVKLNSAEGDYFSLLNQVDPRLGLVADQLLKFTKITAGAGASTLSLTELSTKLTAALKANAGALKLVGAGAVAALGIFALVQAYRALVEEAKRAKEITEATTTATQEASKAHGDAAEAIRKEADQRQRLSKLTIAESEQIQQKAARLAERVPGVDQQQAATLFAQFSGAGIPQEQLEALAVAQAGGAKVTPDPSFDPGTLRVFAEERLQEPAVRKAGRATQQRSAELRRRNAQQLREQAAAGQGEAIQAIAEEITDDPEEQKALLGRIRRTGGTTGGLSQAIEEGAGLGVTLREGPRGIGKTALRSQIGGETAFGGEIEQVGDRGLRQLTSAIELLESRMRTQGPSVGLQYNFGPDANRQQATETNGRSDGRDGEGQ